MTYEQALAKLKYPNSDKFRDKIKVDNNTYAYRLDEHRIAIQLHGSTVVLMRDDGTFTLDSCGFKTVTTKDRINKFSPARVYAKNGLWYVQKANQSFPFLDGMQVTSEGYPVDVENPEVTRKRESLKRQLDKDITRFINGFHDYWIKQGLPKDDAGLQEVTAGDCFMCKFQFGGAADHILGHIAENYYVYSLFMNALRDGKYGDSAVVYHMIIRETILDKRSDWFKRILRKYLSKQKPEMLQLLENGWTFQED